MSTKCLSNVFTVYITTNLCVMVSSHSTSVCWLSAAWVYACIITVRVCTGHGFLQYRCGFSQYWLWSPTAHVYAGSYTVHVCTDCGFPWAYADMTYCSTTIAAGDHSWISSIALCHPKYVCNEEYSYLMVSISYILMVYGVVVGGWLPHIHTQLSMWCWFTTYMWFE